MNHFHPTVSGRAAARAHRRFWDNDADRYHRDHPDYVDGFHWCPEMLTEASAHLLGDVTGSTVVEIGCGSAGCSQWLANHTTAQRVIALDISAAMLDHAQPSKAHLIQADAQALPLASQSVDCAFSAFGALAFLPDLETVFHEVRRILRPGMPWVFSINHPIRWVFPDDPGVAGLTASLSYFDREYVERSSDGTVEYVEYHRTFGDWVAAIVGAGFVLERVVEPEWPADLTTIWGQWSPLRGRIFPGTAIFVTRSPAPGH